MISVEDYIHNAAIILKDENGDCVLSLSDWKHIQHIIRAAYDTGRRDMCVELAARINAVLEDMA